MIKPVRTCPMCRLPRITEPWVLVIGVHTLAAQPGLSRSSQQFTSVPQWQSDNKVAIDSHAKLLQIRGGACMVVGALEIKSCGCQGKE